MKKIKKAGKYFMTVLLVATLLFTWCAQSTVTVSAASKATYTIKKITQKKSYKKVSASYLYELPQLKGSSAAVKKINKSLKKDYQKDQENRESLFDWFESSKIMAMNVHLSVIQHAVHLIIRTDISVSAME